MGPLISKQHMDKVESFIDIGVNEGAKLLIDGRKLKIKVMKMVILLDHCLIL